MQSFWEYLAVLLSSIDLGTVLFVGSLVLAVAVFIGGLVALIVVGERIHHRHAAWNWVFIPGVVIGAAFIIIFASWVGIEVSPNV